MEAGDVIWADLPECGDCIQAGRRPCIVLGNPAACSFSPVVTLVPVSSAVKKINKIPTHVLLTGLKKISIALTEQVRTVNKSCLMGAPIYHLSKDEKEAVQNAINKQFGLNITKERMD